MNAIHPTTLIRIYDHFADAQQAYSALLANGFAAHAVQLDTVGDEAGTVQGKAAWSGMFRLVVTVRQAGERERAHAIVQPWGGSDIEQRTARHAGRQRAGDGKGDSRHNSGRDGRADGRGDGGSSNRGEGRGDDGQAAPR